MYYLYEYLLHLRIPYLLYFYIAEKFGIEILNDIDVTLSVAHFHDVVISKEGHAEGQDILLDIKYQGKALNFNKEEDVIFKIKLNEDSFTLNEIQFI